MKPILVLIAVVLAIGVAIPADAFGQGVNTTKEITFKREQLDAEIAAWKKQLAELVEDLSDPSKIWVVLKDGTTMAADDQEIVQALRVREIMRLAAMAEFATHIGRRYLVFEDKDVFRQQVEDQVKERYAELVKQDRAIREDKEQQAEKLRETIGGLEWAWMSAMMAESQAAGTPAFKPDEATVSDSDKAAVRDALEPVRLRQQWDLRDHGYVLGYLDRRVKTPSQLHLVKKLIADISACYQAWNAENARIAAAAKAGSYISMPVKRIEEGDKALYARNDRLKEIKDTFEKAWRTL